MPKIVPTRLTEYEFTPEELYAATRLSSLTVQLIQTLAARAAQQKIGLTFNPANPNEFIQAEACLTGQIEAYENLIGLVETTPEPQKPGVERKPATQPES